MQFSKRESGSRVERRAGYSPLDIKAFFAQGGDGRSIVKFRKKQLIFSQGDPADTVFYLLEGKIRLTVVSKQGKEAVIATLESGNFFGEGGLAGQRIRMATATAVTDGSLVRIEKEAIIHLLHNHPTFSELFITCLLSRNIRVEEDLVDQLFNSSEKRLARILLLLSRVGKESESEPVVPTISQETLAEMIGTTRARVSFFMNKFKQLGFIEYSPGELRVHSSLLNIVLHDELRASPGLD
ncbi:MAG: Crp/Fnr family transcriptional regulator [Bacillati bacterium ANGP1]|uniref:Crp/Fnr family transcriptional regulator n=1 Tax=Candidatus Segetimicrobium genomatis TaxID=2569760 RepID=A0A537JZ14_9BACT|nr:MAG: Crp/Fnr family transcriptional regulator [Terrabacteria group bacterium ANGP1]